MKGCRFLFTVHPSKASHMMPWRYLDLTGFIVIGFPRHYSLLWACLFWAQMGFMALGSWFFLYHIYSYWIDMMVYLPSVIKYMWGSP